MVFWPQTYKNFGRSDPQWAQARAQYLFARGRGRIDPGVCALRVESPAAGRCLGAGVWVLLGVGVGLLALVWLWVCVAGPAWCLPAVGWGGRVCRLYAWAGVALACWRVGVCAYGFRACPACVICCHLGKFPAFPGLDWRDRFGGLVELVPGGSLAGPVAVAGCPVRPLMWAGVCV